MIPPVNTRKAYLQSKWRLAEGEIQQRFDERTAESRVLSTGRGKAHLNNRGGNRRNTFTDWSQKRMQETPKAKTQEELEAQARDWNARCPIGTPLVYKSMKTKAASPAFPLHGRQVVLFVENVRRLVSADDCEVIAK